MWPEIVKVKHKKIGILAQAGRVIVPIVEYSGRCYHGESVFLLPVGLLCRLFSNHVCLFRKFGIGCYKFKDVVEVIIDFTPWITRIKVVAYVFVYHIIGF